ncbi:hypothetical protein ON010_g3488 [Phytophthora cinnamomi]|nr:hypothetical protein ON010_g3488 [Phytophthora cinnamomi]
MERGNQLLLAVVAAVALLVLGQFALISEESGAYFVEEEPLQLEEKAEQVKKKKTPVFEQLNTLPVVLMHGMGDAAGNGGMVRIQKAVAERLGVYVASVQLGDSVQEDVMNSFFVTMNNQTDWFAKIVREVRWSATRFSVVAGFLTLREFFGLHMAGPAVGEWFQCHWFFSGQLAGPCVHRTHQRPTSLQFHIVSWASCWGGWIAAMLPTQLYMQGDRQDRIAQANYYRDPLRIEAYLKHAQFLPDLNNENTPANQTYKDNFIKLQNLVLVCANKDTQVFPKESEWFGMYQDGDPYKTILGFNETRWYREDLFGLQTLDKAGKVHFLSTDGDHLRFSIEFLLSVVDKYFHPQITQIGLEIPPSFQRIVCANEKPPVTHSPQFAQSPKGKKPSIERETLQDSAANAAPTSPRPTRSSRPDAGDRAVSESGA